MRRGARITDPRRAWPSSPSCPKLSRGHFDRDEIARGGLPSPVPTLMADPADPCPCQEGTRAPRPSSPRPRRAPFPSPADTPFTVSTEAVPPKRQVSQGRRLTKNDQFFKNFFNLALGPQRQEESCRRWPSDEFAEASVPTDIAAPRGGTAAISCQHWGGGPQHGRGTSAWGPLVRYANQVGVAEGPRGFLSSLLTCSWSLPPATREHHTRLG